MSALTSTFANMIRELYTMFCERCQKKTAHRLVEEGRVEVYECVKCGKRSVIGS